MANFVISMVLRLVEQVTAPVKRANAALDSLGKKARGPTGGKGKQLGMLGDLSLASEAAQRFSARIGGLIDRPRQEFEAFQKVIKNITTSTDEIPVDKIEQITKDAALTFGGLPVEQASAFYEIVSAGATDAATATSMLTTANKLALGGQSSTEEAVLGLTKAVANFGVTSEKAGDTLVRTVQLGQLKMTDLAGPFADVAGLAASAGFSIGELGGAIAFGSLKMGGAAQAATGLRGALSNIEKPSRMAQKEAKRLGIDFNQAALQAMGMQKFLAQIFDSKKFNNESLGKLFESTEARSFLQGTRQDMEGLDKIMTQTADSAGTLDAAFRKVDSSQAQMSARNRAAESNAWIEAGRQLEPILADLLPTLTQVLRGVADFVKANPGLTQGILKLALAGKVIGGVISPVMDTVVAFKSLGGIMGVVFRWGTKIPVLGLGLSMLGKTGGAVARLMGRGGPLSIALAGSAAIVMHFRAKIDELKQSLQEVGDDIRRNIPNVTAAESGGDFGLEARREQLAKQLEREERKLKKRRDERGFFTGVSDAVFGSSASSAARDSLKAELDAIDVELSGRREVSDASAKLGGLKGSGRIVDRSRDDIAQSIADALKKLPSAQVEGALKVRLEGLPQGVRARVEGKLGDINVSAGALVGAT